MRVHYERYLGAENWARMTGRSIHEALRDMYGDEDLTLPEKTPDSVVKFERRKEWNRRRREAGNGLPALHPTFAEV